MHILAAIVSLVLTLSIWYYRYRMAKQLAKDAFEAAKKVKNQLDDKKSRKAGGENAFTNIDDPLAGAATIAICILKEQDQYDASVENQVRDLLKPFSIDAGHLKNAIDYGSYASEQDVAPTKAISLIAPNITSQLSPTQRYEVFEFINHSLEQADVQDDIGARYMMQLRKELELV